MTDPSSHRIEFVDELPPTGKRGRVGWRQGVVEQLKLAPGKWALVDPDASVSQSQAWKRLGCEVKSRRSYVSATGTRRCDIYARWPSEQ